MSNGAPFTEADIQRVFASDVRFRELFNLKKKIDPGISTRISGLVSLDSANIVPDTSATSAVASDPTITEASQAVLSRQSENSQQPDEKKELTTQKAVTVVAASGILFAVLSFLAAKISRLG